MKKPDGAAGERDYRPRRNRRDDPLYGTHNEDYMADPPPIHWHCFKETAGLGALERSGGAYRQYGAVPWGRLSRFAATTEDCGPGTSGEGRSSDMIAVENEDQAHAMVRFMRAGRRV